MKKIVLILFVVCWAQNVYAYIDPGTGSMIVQSVIAVIAAVSFTLRLYWKQFKNFFNKNKENIDVVNDKNNGGMD